MLRSIHSSVGNRQSVLSNFLQNQKHKKQGPAFWTPVFKIEIACTLLREMWCHCTKTGYGLS